ncbi:MAG: hypothetical protein GY811_31015 [Myxococcales bacterium]|nr:hypothetical protein [Myxococcales bacterium]
MNTPALTQAISISGSLLKNYHDVIRRIENFKVSGPTAEDAFSTLIGEANRVYVGVWEHLDSAAANFKAAGHEVPEYLQLRATHGHLGILDSESKSQVSVAGSLAIGGLATRTTVDALPNTVGAGHAADFLQQFKQRLPDVDWMAIQREADAPVDDLSPSLTRYWPLAVGVGVVIVAYLALT